MAVSGVQELYNLATRQMVSCCRRAIVFLAWSLSLLVSLSSHEGIFVLGFSAPLSANHHHPLRPAVTNRGPKRQELRWFFSSTPVATRTTTKKSIGSSSTALQTGIGLAEAYEYCLTCYNLPTISLTSAFCGGVGNFAAQQRAALTNPLAPQLQQQLQQSDRNDNNRRFLASIDWNDNRIFWIKGILGGLIWSQWYNFLDSLITDLTSVGAVPAWLAPVLSTVAEQIFFCPVIFSLYELPFPMWLRGDPVDQIPQQVRAKLGPVLWENAKVWTLANLLVYSAPLQWRVLISGIAEAFWQMLLAQQLAADEIRPLRRPVDVYLPLASAEQQQQQQRPEAVLTFRTSAVDRMLEPATVEQR